MAQTRLQILAALLVFCSAPNLAAQEQSVLEQARAEAAAGRFHQATELYRQAVRAGPNNPEALGGLADALEATGRWREAIEPLSRLIQIQPENASRLFQLGRMESWEESKRDRALELLKRAAELRPGDAEFRIAYAEVLSWEASGRPAAMRVLRAVIASHPTDAKARRLQARLLSWQHQRDAALAVLEPLLNRPDVEAADFWTLGQVEEASGNMPAAAAAYRRALGKDPNDLASIQRLAEILSWREDSRPEAVRLFQRGLALDPNNEALLVPYAEMLSWSRRTRPDALNYFGAALARNPDNVRALAGKAQLLAWSGRSQEALALYDRALQIDSSNAAALRGKAEILDWRGRRTEALHLLTRAKDLDPTDSRTRIELARTNYELRNYAAARANLAQVRGVAGPDVDELRRNVNHALGTYLELGYGLRRNKRRLDFHRLEAVVSTPLGTSSRLSVLFRPTLYETRQQDFNGNYYGLELDSQPSERLTTSVSIAGESFPGAPPQVDGALGLRVQVRPSLGFAVGFERAPVEETLLSMRGVGFNGLFLGEVRSNLGNVGATYSNAAHHFDISLAYTDGIYGGRNIASNRRWSVDGSIGKSLHSFQPYVRIAYGFTYLRFDHDADFQPGSASTRVTGGYFSPTRFLLNYGELTVSHRIGRRLKWDASGYLGAQNVETTGSAFSTAQFASSFSTHLIWDLNDQNELRLEYDFLNVFNAFRRNQVFVAWRRYF